MASVIPRAIRRLVKSQRDNLRAALRSRPQSKADYDARFQMSLREWLIHHQQDVIFDKCSWMGVRAIKNPLDAWVYQEIIFEVKPDVIVEIGSYEGGGTLFLAHLLELMGKGTVISIDIDRSRYAVQHDRIIAITGDSASDEVLEQVARLCEGKSVLALHDGDHSRTQVLRDLEAYSKFVSVNSYLIVEDGIVDLFDPRDGLGLPHDGPLAAVEEFLKKNPHFVVDPDRERYILTYSPRGFLRRIE